MTERTRCPVLQIPTDEVVRWYESGWSFVEPAEVPGFSIIAWERPGDPQQPFPTLLSVEAVRALEDRAVGALEGRVA